MTLELAAPNALGLPDSLAFLFLEELGNVLLVAELGNFKFAFVKLFDALLFLFLELNCLLLYAFTLHPELADLAILEQFLSLILLMRCAYSTQYLFVNFAKLSGNSVLLEVTEDTLELSLINQANRGHLRRTVGSTARHRILRTGLLWCDIYLGRWSIWSPG